MPEITIENRQVGAGHPCFIIAEIGVNHNGDIDIAHKMIDAIADAGADCVKFQTFSASEFVNGDDEIYEYISQGKVVRESQLAMFSRLELEWDAFAKLFEHTRQRGLLPLSTPTDKAAADLIETLNPGAYKIGSDDLVYTPFLEYVGAKGKPVIISTGMADVGDIDRALEAFRSVDNEDIAILHCISLYPTPPEEANLNQITSLKQQFPDNVIGFSDHSEGITADLGATMLGAHIIEKHFTLDHNMPGPDQWFSMDPSQLTDLVKNVRRLEVSLGSPTLGPTPGEIDMRRAARRSIVVDRDLEAGHVLSETDIRYQRPGDGLMPYETRRVVGKVLSQDLTANTLLSFDHFEGEV